MVSFERAGELLDDAADALPREIFEKLNGGVNLLPATRTDDDGLLIMGRYIVDRMGRYVEIYYGSFRERLGDATEERWRRELVKTLKHELTHHLENLAYDTSLEKWDAKHKAELLSGMYDEPLEAESVLFVCEDGAGLSAICAGFFRMAAAQLCPGVVCACAGLSDTPPETPGRWAVAAAAEYGADISRYRPVSVSAELLSGFDAVLCMTEAQGDALAERFPQFDSKLMCLGERDIKPPLLDTKGGWLRAADALAAEVEYLAEELGGAEDYDEDT